MCAVSADVLQSSLSNWRGGLQLVLQTRNPPTYRQLGKLQRRDETQATANFARGGHMVHL
jgi:hypothetical protein